MMNADLEALVLSGELFNGHSRSSSPSRSASPDDDPGWHDEELAAAQEKYNEKGLDYDSDTVRRDAINAQKKKEAHPDSIGMGPGRTGVKGVIRDRDEAAGLHREKKAKEVEELRRKMEASNLGGKTFLEEEREKASQGEKADDLVFKEMQKARERNHGFGKMNGGRFGHLREVGVKGFLAAVEREDRDVWVVIHLYDSSLERCYLIDETLARLARMHPTTKFLRAKASSLGFASTNSSSTKPKTSKPYLKPPREDDEDDPYADDEKESAGPDYEDEGDDDDSDVDLDMLPTILVYRGGELVQNWVRVDWEAGQSGIEELLDRHRILPQQSQRHYNLGFPSDDEDGSFDLLWSDDDDIDHDLSF